MKLLKATFEQIYFTGYQYLNQRLGGEVLLEDGETLEDGWNKLKQDADAMHKKMYPHLYEQQEENVFPITYQSIEHQPAKSKEINIAHEKLEIEIDNAKTKEELKSLLDRVIDAGNPVIGHFYNKKLKDLSQ